MGLSGIPGGLGCSCSDAAKAAAPYGVSDYVTARGMGGYGRGMGTVQVFTPGQAIDSTTGVPFTVAFDIPVGTATADVASMRALDQQYSTRDIAEESSGPSLATVLGVPGQITGAFGLTPMQAAQFGFQLAGKQPMPQAVYVPPPAPAISGTTVVIGLAAVGLIGGAVVLSGKKSA